MKKETIDSEKDLSKDFKNFYDKSIYKLNKSIERCRNTSIATGMTSLTAASLTLQSDIGLTPSFIAEFDSSTTLGMAAVGMAVSATTLLLTKHKEKKRNDLIENPEQLNEAFESAPVKVSKLDRMKAATELYKEKTQQKIDDNLLSQKMKAINNAHQEANNDNVMLDMKANGLEKDFENFATKQRYKAAKTLSNSEGLFVGTGIVACAMASFAIQSSGGMLPDALTMSEGMSTMALQGAAALGLGSVLSGVKMKVDSNKLEESKDFKSHIDDFKKTVKDSGSPLVGKSFEKKAVNNIDEMNFKNSRIQNIVEAFKYNEEENKVLNELQLSTGINKDVKEIKTFDNKRKNGNKI